MFRRCPAQGFPTPTPPPPFWPQNRHGLRSPAKACEWMLPGLSPIANRFEICPNELPHPGLRALHSSPLPCFCLLASHALAQQLSHFLPPDASVSVLSLPPFLLLIPKPCQSPASLGCLQAGPSLCPRASTPTPLPLPPPPAPAPPHPAKNFFRPSVSKSCLLCVNGWKCGHGMLVFDWLRVFHVS